MSREYELHGAAPRSPRIDYVRELNEQQYAAVTAPPGPSLVIAGAGSGKTRTLIYRVAYLLEQGIPPDRILLLTFTNKAAREMMRRVSDLLGGDWSALWGGTFHSIGMRLLRRHTELIGYGPSFTILDRDDARDVLKACVVEQGLDKKEHFPKPEVVLEIFSSAVNTRKPVSEILEAGYEFPEQIARSIQELAAQYRERKRAANNMDFDDLLSLWLGLLESHAEIRDHYQSRFQFILVDEYQDTNALQSALIDLLAARHKNVMAVGDDAQSIYSWRGADFQNIFRFPERYPAAATYKIEMNYRSTPEILALANAAIAPNVRQFPKQLAPARPSGVKPAYVTCDDARDQAAFVAQRAAELREGGIPLDRIAVLYRSHFHALELQLELTRHQVPFAITSGIRLFEQAHIKDVAAFLKFVVEPRDALSFARLVKLLPGIGPKAAEKLWQIFETVGKAPVDLVSAGDSPGPPTLAKALRACAGSVPKKALTSWRQWVETLGQLEELGPSGSPADLIEIVLDAGYREYLEENYTNHQRRLEELEQLSSYGAEFDSVHEFLSQLALLSNLEEEEDRGKREGEERLKLSTVHQAKGLEFRVVFLVMLCEGLFPSKHSLESLDGDEEERRLFYVAVTRAQDELYLIFPKTRFLARSGTEQMQLPSRFLNDLPPDLVEPWNLTRRYRPY